MSFAEPGTDTSKVEVTNVSQHGFWLLIENEELFVPFSEFPWFAKAAIDEIVNVERPTPGHLYWPILDIDLSVDSVRYPERYPLVSKPHV